MDTSSSVYYPEVAGWGIAAARINSTGDLALRANDQFRFGQSFAIGAVIPLAQEFLQIVPQGEAPTMMGPPLSIEISFDQVYTSADVNLEINLKATNFTEEVVDEALIAGSFLYGSPCQIELNGGLVEELLPNQVTRVVTDNRFYYQDFGRTPNAGALIQDVFKVYHSNGRPVADGSDQLIQYQVSNTQDIVVESHVRLYPTLPSTQVEISWAEPFDELLVVDQLGRPVARERIAGFESGYTLDVSMFAVGAYRVLLQSERGISVHSMVVAR